MPPKRVIYIDKDLMLRSILDRQKVQEEETSSRTASWRDVEKVVAFEDARWVPRNLPAMLGRLLTPSERKRAQEAIRELEAEGFIDTYTISVRLTGKGHARVMMTKREAARELPPLDVDLQANVEAQVDGQ